VVGLIGPAVSASQLFCAGAHVGAPGRLTMKAGGKPKQRADKLLVDRGLVETRAKAQALIMAGKVIPTAASPRRAILPRRAAGTDGPGSSCPRGGLKLAHALNSSRRSWAPSPSMSALRPAAAPTCWPAWRAKVRVDVGHGQLA
jgi:23S rRNA (cytidine1920-2'-O)/16S rRNA (cytidine1409-2'-O)-methyltransferase